MNEPKHYHLSPDIPEHDGEPIPGLPERLPAGENLLWQGRPQGRGLTARAMGLRAITWYFGALLALQAGLGVYHGAGLVQITGGLVISGLIGLVGLGLLWSIGRAAARGAIYSITDKRVVMRVGIALPMILNIPFAVIESVARVTHADGTEDVVLRIMKPARISWIALWPHVRTASILHPEPMLRALPQADGAAQILARAIAASACLLYTSDAADE
ncbi:MAG: PH domain-containing protein [Rhodospirillales bacterium]|nr:PH domain-containing protein [Rhodospirillales bacterium]